MSSTRYLETKNKNFRIVYATKSYFECDNPKCRKTIETGTWVSEETKIEIIDNYNRNIINHQVKLHKGIEPICYLCKIGKFKFRGWAVFVNDYRKAKMKKTVLGELCLGVNGIENHHVKTLKQREKLFRRLYEKYNKKDS